MNRSISHITVLAIEQMLGSSASNPIEMLEAARAVLKVERNPQANFQIQVAAPAAEAVSLLGGILVRPMCTLDDIEQTDLIVIPALWRNPKAAIQQHLHTSIPWIRQQYLAGASLVAVGTGVTFVAEAGLLDGKAATTHWHYLKQFKRDYPRVNLQEKHLLTQSGRIYCAASVNSAADMMIHWLGQVFGKELGQKVEQQFSPEARNPFEARVFMADLGHQHPDEAIVQVQSWLQQNLAEKLEASKLATMAELSVRQFGRRFHQVTGKTATEYQQAIRCKAAKELLQNSDLAIADIAALVGYQDASHFGRIFRRLEGQSPNQYRSKVRHKVFQQ